MIKVLVVDDERHVVSWLLSLFSGLEDIELDLYSAYSGERALEILDQTKIDVVFSDIRMPGLSGFDLADRIQENWPSSRIIFLTGYNDFQYAYQANEYDCISYLLKTEDDEKIVEALLKAIKSIQQEYCENLLKSRAAVNEQLIDYLREKEFIHEICNEKYTAADVEQLIASANLPFSADQPFFVLMASVCEKETGKLDMFGVRGLTSVYLSRYMNCCCVKKEEDILWVVQAKNQNSAENELNGFSKILETFLTACKETMDIGLFMMWFPKATSIADLGRLIKRLRGFLREQASLTKGESAVFVLTNAQEKQMRLEVNALIDEGTLKLRLALLENYLISGKQDLFFTLFEEIVKCIPPAKAMHSLQIIELYQSIALPLLRRLAQQNICEKEDALMVQAEQLYAPSSFSTWSQATQYLQTVANAIFQISGFQAQDNIDLLIEKIKQYVNQNIDIPLSVETVAKHVNYNASYVSRVFRQGSGASLIEYINYTKMKAAKEMLVNTKYTVQEIAKKVGFESSQYFSTVFKKKENTTPGEYRLKHI
ncbi:MAG: response regulator [Oscillospiraceae bacterium]